MSERIYHDFEPVYDENSRILILGTMPSVLSRQQQFYYGNPQNRFWAVIATVTESEMPQSINEKKELLLKNGIAIWDVIHSCEIEGSSDVSIKGEVVNDIDRILKAAPIVRVYANGAKAYELYMKHCYKKTGREIIKLPSTSPANAAWGLERLIDTWQQTTKL